MRYVAFLGGINVGGHRVSMADLRSHFEAMGFEDVSTFIASGNVVFDATGRPASIEGTIESSLAKALGYAVPTFVRTAAAVRKIAALDPFGTIGSGHSHYVLFLRKALPAAAKKAVLALGNEQDRFEVHGTEVHWLVHGGLMDSSVKPNVLAKALGMPTTNRNASSLKKLAAKLDS